MPMYLVEIHALPGPDAALREFGGAYVNCWIEAPDLGEAVRRALAEVQDAGWDPQEVQHGALSSREDYTGEDDGLAYFEQALIDKEVCVFHIYPVEDEEDEEDQSV